MEKEQKVDARRDTQLVYRTHALHMKVSSKKGKLAARCHGPQNLWWRDARARTRRMPSSRSWHRRKHSAPALASHSIRETAQLATAHSCVTLPSFKSQGGQVSSGTVFCCSRSTCDLTTALKLDHKPVCQIQPDTQTPRLTPAACTNCVA